MSEQVIEIPFELEQSLFNKDGFFKLSSYWKFDFIEKF